MRDSDSISIAVVVVGDPAAREPDDHAPRIAAVVALPRVRAREQAGSWLQCAIRLLAHANSARELGRDRRERRVGELDRLGDPADVEVRERDQQRRVMAQPASCGASSPRRRLEDLAAAILRLGERLPGAADLAQPAHAVEVRAPNSGATTVARSAQR